MATASSSPQVEDHFSVGARISWSAILAGAAVALAVQFLLVILGATIGWSTRDEAASSTMRNAGAIWMIVVTCAAMFAGGLVAAQLTAGENKVEAALYGIVTWATVVAIIAHGASAGSGLFDQSQFRAGANWEAAARDAGVPDAQVREWQTKIAADRGGNAGLSESDVNRAIWYSFIGIWLSMFAAAGGALLGSGPTFRLVAVSRQTAGPVL